MERLDGKLGRTFIQVEERVTEKDFDSGDKCKDNPIGKTGNGHNVF